jgi:hypothetical protein
MKEIIKMNSHVILNHQEHLDIKVIDERSEKLGDGDNFSMVFPLEFRDIQSHYPIFFQKRADTGEFYAAALLGFDIKENLFINQGGWDSAYLPLMSEKQPFFIAFKEDESAIDGKAMMVTLDLNSPRVSTTEGQALFNTDGSPTEFLQEKMDILERVHQANEHSEKFNRALTEHNLLEPFSLDITLADGSNNQLLGFYTINEEALQTLEGATLQSFTEQGFLMPIFMVLASQSRLRDLVDRKNRKNLASSNE